MKGFYILAAIAIVVASLIYMAFRESNADLERRPERLVKSITSVQKILEDSLDPLTRLRREKTTGRLDKQHHRLRTRVDKTERVLNSALHSIETLSDASRADTDRNLKRIGDEVSSLVNEVAVFHSRVILIDWFVAEHITVRSRITELMAAIERRVQERSAKGRPIDSAAEERMTKILESSLRALKLADETLKWVWQDLEQGKVYAEGRINDMNGVVPTLESLLNDLSSD